MKFDYTAYKSFFTADFETSTTEWKVDRARVWLWDICDKQLRHYNGTTIETFFEYIARFDKCLFSFHNLAYDGIYILSYLLENGYIFTAEKHLRQGEFTTIISPLGIHYCYQIRFTNGNTVTINDSLKHNSMSVRELAKIYKLPIQKGEIDYDTVRDINHKPTEEELTYIHYDTEIVMRVLLQDLEHGFKMFTESGNSRLFFKPTIGKTKEEYKEIFPDLTDEEDEYVRRAYRGGYCYLKPDKFNKMLYGLMSVDINSMYPAQMLHKPLPYGKPMKDKGFAEDSEYFKQDTTRVYVQHLEASFSLKPNHLPTIARKSFRGFNIKDLYLSNSGEQVCSLYLCAPDLKLFFENYNVWNLKYIDCYIFNTKCGKEVNHEQAKTMELDDIIREDGKGSLYYDYLYPWRMQKEHTTGGERSRAKKQQNIGYGWQATSKEGTLSFPYINEKGVISFKRYEGEKRQGGYIPIAAFITAYSREYLITNILKVWDRFVYCDTDSMYILGQDEPNIPIHKSLYGYFKIEHYIKRAKYLGCKRYMYETEEYSEEPNQTIVKCCGAPDEVTSQMTFENFVPNAEFSGKIQAHTVRGGKHLENTTYRLVC